MLVQSAVRVGRTLTQEQQRECVTKPALQILLAALSPKQIAGCAQRHVALQLAQLASSARSTLPRKLHRASPAPLTGTRTSLPCRIANHAVTLFPQNHSLPAPVERPQTIAWLQGLQRCALLGRVLLQQQMALVQLVCQGSSSRTTTMVPVSSANVERSALPRQQIALQNVVQAPTAIQHSELALTAHPSIFASGVSSNSLPMQPFVALASSFLRSPRALQTAVVQIVKSVSSLSLAALWGAQHAQSPSTSSTPASRSATPRSRARPGSTSPTAT
jgi:hypothetical protein